MPFNVPLRRYSKIESNKTLSSLAKDGWGWKPQKIKQLKRYNLTGKNNIKHKLVIFQEKQEVIKKEWLVDIPSSKDVQTIKDALAWAVKHFTLPVNINIISYTLQSRGFYAIKKGIEPECILLFLGKRSVQAQSKDHTVGEKLYYTTTRAKLQREFILKSSLYHELGHALHQYQNLRYYKTLSDDSKEKPPTKQYITDLKNMADDISTYAASNSMEFVAESFSGFCCGLEYPKTVYEALFLCGGPYLPSRPASKGKVVFSF
jgi:hypothetical protein